MGLAPPAANLRQSKPGGGTFIAFATETGSWAQDGEGDHSPFTKALLTYLTKPISLVDMFAYVNKEVRLVTNRTQRPVSYSSMEGAVCLTGTCSTAPISSGMEDAASQANRSIEEELQIALQTNNPDALQTYLDKYPDTPKLLEISEQIASLRRSEFNEWTLFQLLVNQKSPVYLQISSIKPFGDRVAVRHRTVFDPSLGLSLPGRKGREFPEGALWDSLYIYDCKQPISARADDTIVSKSGETLYHYKWADPKFLDMSLPLDPGSVGLSARNLVCHEGLRTPLVSKKQLTSMSFSSLSSTVEGDGDIFYKVMQNDQSTPQDKKEILFIIRSHTESVLTLNTPFSTSTSFPKYLFEVHHSQLSCTDNTFTSLKRENYDASGNLIYITVNPLISWSKFKERSPFASLQPSEFKERSPFDLLQRIVCPYGGLGIEVASENSLIKVVRVMDGTPAAEGGIKVNDIITHLNDVSADGLALNQAIEKMRGPAGTKIELKIRREGQERPIELSVTRTIIRPSAKEVQK